MIDSNTNWANEHVELTLDTYEQAILERGIRLYRVVQRLDLEELSPGNPDRCGFDEMLRWSDHLIRRLQAASKTASKATSRVDYDIQFTLGAYEQMIAHRSLRLYQEMSRLDREDV